jgi:hypothetical protein
MKIIQVMQLSKKKAQLLNLADPDWRGRYEFVRKKHARAIAAIAPP